MNALKISLLLLIISPLSRPYASEIARPNIVFIEVDDLLYRFLGKIGRGLVETPHIDSLAENGVYFQNALAQGPMCGPSRNGLITGLYSHNLGFYRNGHMGSLPEGIWNIGGAMKRSGYSTAWVGKCHVHPPHLGDKKSKPSASEGLRQMGFDYAVASLGRAMLGAAAKSDKLKDGDIYVEHLRKHGLLEQYIDDCKKKRKITTLPEEHYLDGFYTETANKWLTDYKEEKPFFLWLNYSCPHGPHDAPQKYHDLYKDKEIPGPLTKDFGGAQIPAVLLTDAKQASVKKLADSRRGFAANTTFVDTMIGKVINTLKTNDQYENSLIVFFSDHGVFMGNHNRIHKGTIFNETTNPSLIFHYPKAFKKGFVEKTPVELLGIIKTALDIAQASDEEKNQPFSHSILPLLNDQGEYKAKYAFSEIAGAQVCFDGRYRYYTTAEDVLLYDISNDALEINDISKQFPEIVKKMQAATDLWLKNSGPVLAAKHLRDAENLKNWKRIVVK